MTTTQSPRTATAAFWVSACFFVLWALGWHTLHGSEDRWAEVTREMFLRRDFFHPTINAQPYFDKPLLGYWLVALVSVVTGRLDEWAVRLPGAVASLLTLWATIRLGRTLWSAAVGRTAAWLLLTTYGFLWWAKRGEADMENLAAITGALAWYWAHRERLTFGHYLVFYLICFIGAHTKGLGAVAVPAVALLPDVLRGGRWRAHLNLANVLALGVGVAVYLTPFVYATFTHGDYQSSGLALVFRENVQRYFEPFDHTEPFYVYLYYLPELFLPWAPLVLVALASVSRALRRPYDATRWLAEAFVLVFLFFTLSGSRRVYYILPAMPLAALATALFLHDEATASARRWGIGLQTAAFAALAGLTLAGPALAAVLAPRYRWPLPADLMLVAPLLGVLALAAFGIARRRAGQVAGLLGVPRVAAPLIGATAVLAALGCWSVQSIDRYRTKAPFARQLGALVRTTSPDMIVFYKPPQENVLFYADLPVPVRMIEKPDGMTQLLAQTTTTKVVVVEQVRVEEALAALPAEVRGRPTLTEEVHPWEERHSQTKQLAWFLPAPGR
jgi:4-amino-4-deoxy-L-arabinose transferase-like glycosyltransferase